MVLLLDLWRIFSGNIVHSLFLGRLPAIEFMRNATCPFESLPFWLFEGLSDEKPVVCTMTTTHIVFFLQFQDEVRLGVGAARQRVSFLLKSLEQTEGRLLLHLFEATNGRKELRQTNSREMPDLTICGGRGNGSRQGQPCCSEDRHAAPTSERNKRRNSGKGSSLGSGLGDKVSSTLKIKILLSDRRPSTHLGALAGERTKHTLYHTSRIQAQLDC